MIRVVDSWEEPTDAQLAAAVAAGYGAWMGYFKEYAYDNIYHGWSDLTFRRVQAHGLKTGDYCSQIDDPTWVRNRAAALGIVAILDDENGIDPDNAGTDGWLAAAGAHVYGGSGVQSTHRLHAHAGYIFSEYPTAGNPNGLNWPAGFARPSPARPVGWQWSNKGSVGGVAVDLSIFDPAIFGAPTPPTEEGEMLVVFTATVVAGPSTGVNAQFVSNGMRFRWIQNPSQLGDILNGPGLVFNSGPVQQWPGGAVADVGAFGNPDDPETATMLGLTFPGAAGPPGPTGATGATGTPGPPGAIPATAKVTGTVTLT